MKVIFIKNLENVYVYEEGRVYKSAKKEKGVYTSVLKHKNIYTFSFKLPIDVKEDELELEVEKYLYSEEALDFSKDYKINFVYRKQNDEYIIEAFVAEVEKIKKEFEEIVNKYKYIDFISPSFFAFSSYYDVKKEDNFIDLFIYFDEEDSYSVCFSNKEFIFVKGLLKFSMLKEDLGDKTKEILEKKGLIQENYENLDEFYKVDNFFTQFFSRLNSIINYNLPSYNLNKIDRIFFYSPFKINGLVDKYKDFWNLSGIEFDLLKIDTDYNEYDYLATLFNAKNYKKENINFSIFKKPLPFYKRESGKLLLFSLILLGIISADAGYKYYKMSLIQKDIQNYKKIFQKKKELAISIKKKEKELKSEIDKIKNEIAFINKNIKNIKSSIDLIYNDVCKKNFIDEYSLIAKALDKNRLKVYFFEKNKNKYILKVVSNYDNSENIASFLKDMVSLGFKNVSSNVILNSKDKYLSIIRFEDE